MKYENPTIPEGINTSRRHPLLRLARFLGTLGVLLLVAVFLLRQATEWVVPQIPFAWEKRLVEQYLPENDDESHARLLSYLQWLAQRLAVAGNLPEDMTITVHYRDEATVNAVAGLGGHITIYRGLLERAGSENALALAMAHEIAHIRQRHPLTSLGSWAVFRAVLAVVTGSTGDAVAGKILDQLGMVADLRFSREQERQADAEALSAVYALYGHVSGAYGLYEYLLRETDGDASSRFPEFAQTHPALKKRLEDLRNMARKRGWSDDGPVLTLPKFPERHSPN